MLGEVSRQRQRAIASAAVLAALRVAYVRSPALRVFVWRISLGIRAIAVVSWRRYWRGPIQEGWTFLFELLLEIVRFGPLPNSIDFMRRYLNRTLSRLPIGTTCEKEDVDGIPAEWITCCDKSTQNVVLYLHGGGYALMSVATHKPLIARISRATHARCIGIEYRLAPENPFPAAIEDAVKAYRWLVKKKGISPSRIMIGGDSAGGGLTVATLLTLRDLGDPLPAAAILISPWVDLTCSMPSWKRYETIDYLGKAPGPNQPMMLNLPALYAAGHDLKHPLISPMFADLTGLCPMILQVGGVEVFHDEGIMFAKKAKEVGVDITIEVWPHMPHVFQAFGHVCPEGAKAIEHIGKFAGKYFGRETKPNPEAGALSKL